MTTRIQSSILAMLSMIVIGGIVSVPASADEHRFRRVERPEWSRGRWIHDRHDGRLGWWWVIGSDWRYFERPHSFVQPQTVIVEQGPPPPVIIQQAPVPPPPPVTVIQQAPPVSPVLYYCRATGTHYPETMTCPGGWTTMTAETPPQP